MILQLTGLQYYDIKKLKDICPGNAVDIIREPIKDMPEGRAYKAMCKGLMIGYIPLVSTIGRYQEDASSDEKVKSLNEWIEATKAVRVWLNSRETYMLESKWTVRVKTLLYNHNGVYKRTDNGKVAAVAVDFEDVPKD